MNRVFRFLHTLRWLRASQVLWRIKYILIRYVENRWKLHLADDSENAPSLDPVFGSLAAKHSEVLRPKFYGSFRRSELSRGRLTLLNKQKCFNGGADWGMQGKSAVDRIWLYNLHYHKWLFEAANGVSMGDSSEQLTSFLSDWISTCRPGTTGFTEYPWNSYAIATRLRWWALLYYALPKQFWVERAEMKDRFIRSYWLQARYLYNHIEWDLRGNHLIRDASGLAFAGRFLSGWEAKSWLRKAEGILAEQSEEQVLQDGGHVERSPMYHILVMEDVFWLSLLLNGIKIRERLLGLWCKMLEYLRWVRFPDGEIPLLNDAALNGALKPFDLLRLGKSVGLESYVVPPKGAKCFWDTGLVVYHGEDWSLFFDVGQIGPDWQPGHGHADSLTISCSYLGKRLFVDPGTHSYDADERRAYDRSTAAHNTVTIDGISSSEVWHIFRVARRAKPQSINVDVDNGVLRASASHDGYDRILGRPKHLRRIFVGNKKALVVEDKVTGKKEYNIQGGYLLGPAWEVVKETGGSWIVRCNDVFLNVCISSSKILKIKTKTVPFHARFHVEDFRPRLCWEYDGNLPILVRTVVEPIR